MPDISMCKGGECSIKELCYRYTAKPSYLQTYFSTPPYDKETKECNYYWDNNKGTAKRI